jgi:tryptophan synthase alpha chain
MIDEGAAALELGVAFSDPVADGAIIQAAAFETLASGFHTDDALALVAKVRAYNAEIPIGLLTYFNIVHARGVSNFMARCASSGVDSLLVADLTPDDVNEIGDAALQSGISPVFIASPLTSDERLRKIAAYSQAYIYVVSRLGITGAKEQHDEQLGDLLKRAHAVTDLPLCVGFGVSSEEAARRMIALGADGVITGSKIVELLRSDGPPEYQATRTFLRQMRAATSAPVHHQR